MFARRSEAPRCRLPPRTSKPILPKSAAARKPAEIAGGRQGTRRAAGMEPRRSLPRASMRRSSSAISTAPTPNAVAFAEAYKGKLAGAGGRPDAGQARRGGEALRGARGPARAAHVLRRPRLRRRHHRSGAREILRRHAGAHHGGLARICCSSRSNSTASTMRRSTPRWRIRRSAITGRGSRTCARRSRTSSRTASSSCSTRSR